ncbi:ABC transporter ATP-binding protein [Sulfurimonas sp. SAG-AH-194-I05]|nr:ATP-binding cassette domain-containing protein [Sulfurimonas sp. SAG-AH-194-I05]MDF1875019.1 ABC transporter ATP-binding protein [Sulfurimonas sp. SAG-AH-194-I05]
MREVILEVKKVYKKYYNDDETKYKYTKKNLKSLFQDTREDTPTLDKGETWSLENISFSLNKGDSLAILGDRNSGKSILIRLLSETLYSDYGSIKSPQKRTVLKDLRLGISGHLNVIDNLYLKAALVSISKKSLDSNIHSLLDFAELDNEILTTPWKYLTTDIKNRIMYSFFVTCRRDFFIVDGITHVGDAEFAKKCKKEIVKISESSTFIIATRKASKVKNICNKVLILEKGKMIFFGSLKDGLTMYEK